MPVGRVKGETHHGLVISAFSYKSLERRNMFSSCRIHTHGWCLVVEMFTDDWDEHVLREHLLTAVISFSLSLVRSYRF